MYINFISLLLSTCLSRMPYIIIIYVRAYTQILDIATRPCCFWGVSLAVAYSYLIWQNLAHNDIWDWYWSKSGNENHRAETDDWHQLIATQVGPECR